MSTPLIDALGLRRHPEGGWYAETWRAGPELDTPRGRRPTATGILYLLEPGQESAWHRVASDELWLAHTGVLEMRLGGQHARPSDTRPSHSEPVLLGGDVVVGQQPQVLVPAGCWQTARPTGSEAVLVTCVVSPGFDYLDFEMLPA